MLSDSEPVRHYEPTEEERQQPVVFHDGVYYCTECGDEAHLCTCGAMDAVEAAEAATWD